MRGALFLFVLLASPLGPLAAQEAPTPPANAGFCLRPQPSCRVSTITEFMGMLKLGGIDEDSEQVIGANLGFTYQFGARYGVGLLGNFNVHEPGAESLLIKARGRAWLTPSLTVDVSPGVILKGSDWFNLSRESVAPDLVVYRSTSAALPGFSVDAAVGWSDWAALALRVDVLPYDHVDESTMRNGTVVSVETLAESGSFTEVFLGIRLGSYAGLALNVAVPLVAGAVYLIACSGGGCTS